MSQMEMIVILVNLHVYACVADLPRPSYLSAVTLAPMGERIDVIYKAGSTGWLFQEWTLTFPTGLL